MVWFILFYLFAHFNVEAQSGRHEPHLSQEVKIVDYTGPITREMLTLFRSAEVIELINCNITSVSDRLYTLAPKLKKIFVDNVTLTNVPTNVAIDGSGIEEFHYVRCTWNDLKIQAWNDLHNLEKLVFSESRNPLVEIKPGTFNETKLKFLEISWSGVEKIHDSAFDNLHKLETLNLSGNKLKFVSKETFKPLRNLKNLDLHANLLETFELVHSPNLEILKLSQNPLKIFNLIDVRKSAPNLKKLDYDDTKLQLPAPGRE